MIFDGRQGKFVSNKARSILIVRPYRYELICLEPIYRKHGRFTLTIVMF